MRLGKCSTKNCKLRGLKREMTFKVGKCEVCGRILKPVKSTTCRFGVRRETRIFGK
jgi:hypothetical protein